MFLRYRAARHSPDPLASTVLALLALFALYPVGHAQFYFPVFVLLLLLHARGLPSIRMGCFIGWISGITLSDHLVTVSGGSNLLIREYAGLPTFIVALAHELYRETSPTGTARGSSGEPARGSNST